MFGRPYRNSTDFALAAAARATVDMLLEERIVGNRPKVVKLYEKRLKQIAKEQKRRRDILNNTAAYGAGKWK